MLQPKRFTIDRFEGLNWAVLETDESKTISVPRSWLPPVAREGDVLQISEGDEPSGARTIRLEVDPAAREAQTEDARRLRDQLPKGPKGDISL